MPYVENMKILLKIRLYFGKKLIGCLKKYKSIKAEQIAKAMIYYSKQETKGVMKHESGELQKV